MSSIDFLCQDININKAALIGLLCCLALPTNADPPSIEEFIQPNELVLTPSAKWAEPNKATQNLVHKPHQTNQQQVIRAPKSTQANVGCGMDVNQIPTTDTSLTSRVVGKCNFNYQY